MHLPVRFQPLYQPRVWGGRALGGVFARSLPGTEPIGESWEIVDRPEAQSVVGNGPLAGMTLREALHLRCADWIGPDWPVTRPFPILVKWLDCRERLSLQVHPPAEIAPAMHGEPKTENWYLAGVEGEAGLLLGLRPGVTRGQFAAAIKDNSLEPCVNRYPVKVGDSVLVHSGTVHAIDAGCLILEIQQNSDTTYRVYDWGRVGLDGKPRQLHLAESMKSILFDEPPPPIVRAADVPAVIADCAEFRIRRVPVKKGATSSFLAGEQCRLFSVVRGRLLARGLDAAPFVAGDNALLPFAGAFTFEAAEDSLVLVTENFS
jgi:mannose-6-phosphate isomerase